MLYESRSAEMAKQVLDMNLLALDRRLFLGASGNVVLVRLEQISQRANCHRLGFPIPRAVRKDEDTRIGIRRHFQPSTFKQTNRLIDTGKYGFGLALVACLERSFVRLPRVSEPNVETARGTILKQARHGTLGP